MNGLLDYLSVFAVVYDVDVEIDSEDLLDLPGPDGVLEVVVDDGAVVVVGDYELIGCLVKFRANCLVILHFFGIQEDFIDELSNDLKGQLFADNLLLTFIFLLLYAVLS